MTTATPPHPDVDALFAATYRELRQLARARLRGGGRNTVLDTTALVHETYLKLGAGGSLQFQSQAQFMAYAGKVMRSVIVDLVRQRRSERRGGDVPHLTLTGEVIDLIGAAAGEEQILQVHEALQAMARLDERMTRVVELRYFGGLTDAEVAAALGVSERTVRHDWSHARVFLAQALG